MLPASTALPGTLLADRLSPVITASSTWVDPSRTTPSTVTPDSLFALTGTVMRSSLRRSVRSTWSKVPAPHPATGRPVSQPG